jgi:hypothetical protein
MVTDVVRARSRPPNRKRRRAPRSIFVPSNLGRFACDRIALAAFRGARACAGKLVKTSYSFERVWHKRSGSRVCEVLERLFRFVMTGNPGRFLYQIQRCWKVVPGNTQRCITGISATHNDSCFYFAIFFARLCPRQRQRSTSLDYALKLDMLVVLAVFAFVGAIILGAF